MPGVSIKQLSNVGYNGAVSVRDKGVVLGTVEYVLLEAVVSMIIRKIARAPRRRFIDEVVLHAVSVPFIGGLSAPMGKQGNSRSGYQRQFIDGSKGVPAVLLAQYIQQMGERGFHVPAPDFRDILVTAASKMITRPLTKVIYDFSPAVIKEHIARMNLLFARQENASLLAGVFATVTSGVTSSAAGYEPFPVQQRPQGLPASGTATGAWDSPPPGDVPD